MRWSEKTPKPAALPTCATSPIRWSCSWSAVIRLWFAEAAKLAADLGAHSLDINMGCPVRKIVNNNSGSALMKDPLLAAKIIETTAAATPLKVSVKFRKGWDHDHVNAVEFARMCEESGAAYVTVHGRTRSDFYAGTADWDIIAAVKDAVKIPVVANGDVADAASAAKILHHTGADGLMIGRAALGAPWLIADIDRFLKTGKEPETPAPGTIKTVLIRHIRGLCDYYGERTALQLSQKICLLDTAKGCTMPKGFASVL